MLRKNTITEHDDHLTMLVPSSRSILEPAHRIKLDKSSLPIISQKNWEYDIRGRVKCVNRENPIGIDLAEAVFKIKPKGATVCFKNGDSKDYRRDNLELCD